MTILHRTIVPRCLIAKDLRLLRLPTVVLVMVCVGCHLIAAGGTHAWNYWGAGQNVLHPFCQSALLALAVTALMGAVFGGTAFAAERSDRSADFIALLPVTRWQITLSKWIVIGVILGTCTLSNAIVAIAFETGNPSPWTVLYLHPAMHIVFAVIWLCVASWFFGVAWLLGTFLHSGPICACTAIAVTVAVGVFMIAAGNASMGNATAVFLVDALAIIVFAAGFLSLIAGTFYYLKRIAP